MVIRSDWCNPSILAVSSTQQSTYENYNLSMQLLQMKSNVSDSICNCEIKLVKF